MPHPRHKIRQAKERPRPFPASASLGAGKQIFRPKDLKLSGVNRLARGQQELADGNASTAQHFFAGAITAFGAEPDEPRDLVAAFLGLAKSQHQLGNYVRAGETLLRAEELRSLYQLQDNTLNAEILMASVGVALHLGEFPSNQVNKGEKSAHTFRLKEHKPQTLTELGLAKLGIAELYLREDGNFEGPLKEAYLRTLMNLHVFLQTPVEGNLGSNAASTAKQIARSADCSVEVKEKAYDYLISYHCSMGSRKAAAARQQALLNSPRRSNWTRAQELKRTLYYDSLIAQLGPEALSEEDVLDFDKAEEVERTARETAENAAKQVITKLIDCKTTEEADLVIDAHLALLQHSAADANEEVHLQALNALENTLMHSAEIRRLATPQKLSFTYESIAEVYSWREDRTERAAIYYNKALEALTPIVRNHYRAEPSLFLRRAETMLTLGDEDAAFDAAFDLVQGMVKLGSEEGFSLKELLAIKDKNHQRIVVNALVMLAKISLNRFFNEREEQGHSELLPSGGDFAEDFYDEESSEDNDFLEEAELYAEEACKLQKGFGFQYDEHFVETELIYARAIRLQGITDGLKEICESILKDRNEFRSIDLSERFVCIQELTRNLLAIPDVDNGDEVLDLLDEELQYFEVVEYKSVAGSRGKASADNLKINMLLARKNAAKAVISVYSDPQHKEIQQRAKAMIDQYDQAEAEFKKKAKEYHVSGSDEQDLDNLLVFLADDNYELALINANRILTRKRKTVEQMKASDYEEREAFYEENYELLRKVYLYTAEIHKKTGANLAAVQALLDSTNIYPMYDGNLSPAHIDELTEGIGLCVSEDCAHLLKSLAKAIDTQSDLSPYQKDNLRAGKALSAFIESQSEEACSEFIAVFEDILSGKLCVEEKTAVSIIGKAEDYFYAIADLKQARRASDALNSEYSELFQPITYKCSQGAIFADLMEYGLADRSFSEARTAVNQYRENGADASEAEYEVRLAHLRTAYDRGLNPRPSSLFFDVEQTLENQIDNYNETLENNFLVARGMCRAADGSYVAALQDFRSAIHEFQNNFTDSRGDIAFCLFQCIEISRKLGDSKLERRFLADAEMAIFGNSFLGSEEHRTSDLSEVPILNSRKLTSLPLGVNFGLACRYLSASMNYTRTLLEENPANVIAVAKNKGENEKREVKEIDPLEYAAAHIPLLEEAVRVAAGSGLVELTSLMEVCLADAKLWSGTPVKQTEALLQRVEQRMAKVRHSRKLRLTFHNAAARHAIKAKNLHKVMQNLAEAKKLAVKTSNKRTNIPASPADFSDALAVSRLYMRSYDLRRTLHKEGRRSQRNRKRFAEVSSSLEKRISKQRQLAYKLMPSLSEA